MKKPATSDSSIDPNDPIFKIYNKYRGKFIVKSKIGQLIDYDQIMLKYKTKRFYF